MATHRTKLRVVVFSCLGVLLFALGCILSNGAGYPNSIASVRSLTLTIDKSQREELFDQLQKFAEKHDFETDLTDSNSNGENIQFWMQGAGVQVVVFINRTEPNGMHPGNATDEELVDELLDDLKSYINEIPIATITEEK